MQSLQLALLLLPWMSATASNPYVTVTTTAPSVLDSVVSFWAQLHRAEEDDRPLIFRWSDDAR